MEEFIADYADSQQYLHIDHYIGEEGKTIAIIDLETKKVFYIESRFRLHPVVKEIIKENLHLFKPKYYRVYDKQTGCYRAWGYNSTSLKELRDAFVEYTEVDSDEEDYSKLPLEDIIDLINTFEFYIESSESPFEDKD